MEPQAVAEGQKKINDLFKEYGVTPFTPMKGILIQGPIFISFFFAVLVRNVPPDADESTKENVEHFFLVNHPDHYLSNQVIYNANSLAKLVKEMEKKKNSLDFYHVKYSRNPEIRPTTKCFLGRVAIGSSVPGSLSPLQYITPEVVMNLTGPLSRKGNNSS